LRIVSNIISITLGQAASIIILLVIFGYVTRHLEVAEFGQFNYWLAVIGILSKGIDFGFGPILLRECSKGNDCNNNISSVFIFRTFLFVGLLIVLNLFIFSYPTQTIILANILMANILFTSKDINFRDLLYIFFKKDLRMHIPAMVNLFDAILLLILVIPIRFVDDKFNYFLIVYLVANIPGYLFIVMTVIKRYNLKLQFNFSNLKWLMRESLPLYGFVFLSYIYLQLDIFMINYFEGEDSVGLYSAAVRVTRPLLIIPSAFVMTFVPILVKKIESKSEIQKEVLLVLKLLMLMAIVFVNMFYFKASFFMTLIFGSKYLIASDPARYLFVALVFLFFNFFVLDLLTIHNKQRYNLIYIIIVVISAFVFNLIFIPLYSINGAAFSRILSAMVGFGFLLVILRQIIGRLNFIDLKLLFWIFVNIITVYFLKDENILIYLLVSFLMIIFSLLIFKIFTSQEQSFILSAFKKKK